MSTTSPMVAVTALALGGRGASVGSSVRNAVNLHPAQEQVLSESARFNALMCGRRWGKTVFGVKLGTEAALDGQPVGWFAPTYKILADAWRDCKRILAPVTAEKNETEKRLVLTTGGTIEAWSLDVEDAGRSRKYARVIVDEAGLVPHLETIWNESIRPTLSDLRGDAWFLGTPKGRRFFWTLYLRGQSHEPGWASWQMGTVSNPYINPAEIEDARRDLPEAAFRQEYEGVPMEDVGNPFGVDAIRACLAEPSGAPPVVWGWDLAKSYDWTVGIALDANGRVCLPLERWQKPWGETEDAIHRIIGGASALVDSTGVGDPIVEALQRRGAVEGFQFTAKSKQQLMEGLAAAIQRGEIRFPDGVLRRELESFEYEYKATGVRYSAPSGLHDDCVCALALAVHKWRQIHAIAPGLSDLPSGQELADLIEKERNWEAEALRALKN